MTWAPTHGCALPLPKRNHAKYGVRQHGPKPSQMFMAIQKDDHLHWMYLNGGEEAVSDFLLARLEIGVKVGEDQAAIRLVRQCQAVTDGKAKPTKAVKALVKEFEKRAKTEQQEAEKAWETRRQQLIARDAARRQVDPYEQMKRRIAAAPKPAVVTLQRQRLERSLQATPTMPEPTTASTPAPATHSRKAKGECGQRIGRKIDRLLEEIRHEAACESNCCAAPVAVLEPPAESSVDPPATASGVMAERAPDEPAAGGCGFINPSAWELLTDTNEEVAIASPITLLIQQLEESPQFRRGQVAGALAELKTTLEKTSHCGNGNEAIQLEVGTVVVLAHTLLRHQP